MAGKANGKDVKSSTAGRSGSSAGSAGSAETPAPLTPNQRLARYTFVLVLLGVTVLAWLSLLTFSPADPPSTQRFNHYPRPQSVRNAAGVVGAHVAYFCRYWIGAGVYVGLAMVTAAAAAMLTGWRVSAWPWRLAGLAVVVTATSAAFYSGPLEAGADIAQGPAGVLGLAVGRFVLSRFSDVGGVIVLVLAMAIGVLLAAENVLLAGARLAWHGWGRFRERRRAATEQAKAAKAATQPAARVRAPQAEAAQRRQHPQPQAPASAPAPAAAKAAPEPKKKAKASTKPSASTPSPGMPELPFELPPVDLLDAPKSDFDQIVEGEAAQRQEVLQQTLDDFNVKALVVGYETGPVITLYEIALDPGVKVSQINTLSTDIARALAVPAVRIVPPRFGKDTVGVEVPNHQKEMVRIRELMNLGGEAATRMSLPLYLGKDAGGEPIISDLSRMPHLLIAGTTGSGKSVCINSIIMSMLMLRKPDEVRLVLVDPKMVEMAAFEDIPHLLCPIVNDMRKAEEILEWAATKMDERYELLKEARVKNIAGFNKLSPEDIYKRFGAETEDEQKQITTHLPYYVVIIDELADLIMTADKEVEAHIIRIAQKARAVGIHLILATQRPSANVVTGLIRSNMPCRISFRVASRLESRIVLDQNGAEVLLGQGDMLFLEPGEGSLKRAQGTFVEDSEIHAVMDALRASGKPDYHPELMRLNSRPAGELDTEKDGLFDKAVEVVLQTQRGSVSLLQRKLQIGYTRAARIIDQMAEAGLLGDFKGSKARECTMTLEEWQELQNSIEADQSGASAANGEPTSV